jgi:hypothetical protein
MAFALFILYVVLAYIQPGEIVPELAPYRVTYWVGMAGLATAIVALLGRGLFANLQLWALIAFTAVTAGSLVIAERWMGAPVLVLQRFGPSLTIFVLAMCSVTTLGRLRLAAGCVIVLTMALMLQGAAAYHLGYNTQQFLLDRTASGEDPADDLAEDQADLDFVDQAWDDLTEDDGERTPPRIRALGFMHDPNDLAVAIVVALGLLGGAWRPRMPLRNLLIAAAAGGLVYGIYLTRSRGGAMALIVVLWRFAAGRVGRFPAFVLLVALGAGLLALDFGGRTLSTELDSSASERLVAWREGLAMLKTEPFLGVGYGRFLDHHTLTAHNSLVLCFAETGLFGSFFWVGLFVITLLELHRVKNLPGAALFDDVARRWAEGLQLSLFGFMTAAFFLSRTFAPTLYLIIGLAAALAAIARHAGRPIPLPAPPALGLLVFASVLGSIAVVYTMVKLHFA